MESRANLTFLGGLILGKEQIPNHVIPAFENLKTQSSRYLERANGILNMICGLY